jgi:hypothetical protein
MFYYSWRLFKGKRQNSQENLIVLMGISYQFLLITAIECLLSIRVMPSIAGDLMNSIAGQFIFQWLCQESVVQSPGHIGGVTHFGVMGDADHTQYQALKITNWLPQLLTRKLPHRWLTASVWVEEWFWAINWGKPLQLEMEETFIQTRTRFLVLLWEFTSKVVVGLIGFKIKICSLFTILPGAKTNKSLLLKSSVAATGTILRWEQPKQFLWTTPITVGTSTRPTAHLKWKSSNQ